MEKNFSKLIDARLDAWQKHLSYLREDLQQNEIVMTASIMNLMVHREVMSLFEKAVFHYGQRFILPMSPDMYKYLKDRYPNYPEILWLTGNSKLLSDAQDYKALAKIEAWAELAKFNQWSILAEKGQWELLAICKQWSLIAKYGEFDVLAACEQWQMLADHHQWDLLAKCGQWSYIYRNADPTVWQPYAQKAYEAGFRPWNVK